MVCVDSDVLIDFLRNKKDAINKFQEVKNSGQQLSTTSINVFELLVGTSRYSSIEYDSIKNFLNNFLIYDFDFDSAEKASEIFSDLKSNGQMIQLPDIMIASIVLSNNESLLTRNTNHFEKIKGLDLYTF